MCLASCVMCVRVSYNLFKSLYTLKMNSSSTKIAREKITRTLLLLAARRPPSCPPRLPSTLSSHGACGCKRESSVPGGQHTQQPRRVRAALLRCSLAALAV